MGSETLGSKLHRLATSIVAGDVVFFIGAGFSLESERNSAGVLIARLLARFEAIASVVAATPSAEETPLAKLCADLRSVLLSTFQVKPDRRGVICGRFFVRNIRRLQQDYYLINDWMCSAYDALLDHCDRLQTLSEAIHEREVELLGNYLSQVRSANQARPQRADFARYAALVASDDQSPALGGRARAGKAFFLDTMGFANPEVMIGDPLAPLFEHAMNSYKGRLRERHAVLAWLALEGVLPVVLTTNYDMLLEGGYRVAGMLPRVPGVSRGSTADLDWNRRLRYFTPISEATQFFTHGDGYASALILKIHGCVRSYREHRSSEEPGSWRGVLRTIVFTFREIQNWREDSWSRDYIKTLLRTRTVAFVGYSTADPVIHDTFRNVYEEMARYRVPRRGERATAADAGEERGTRANAFFFRYGAKSEFHALEILRAASRAAGDRHPELANHPNLIGFSAPDRGFPTLDEALVWTFHLAYRRLQEQALESELRRGAYQLFGHPPPERDAEALVAQFQEVLAAERECADGLYIQTEAVSDPQSPYRVSASRRRLCRMTAWTVEFHRRLMREYAAADLVLRKPEGARRVHRAMRWPWYAPLNEHPDWAAWGVVLELALRKRCAEWVGSTVWQGMESELEPVAADRPAVLVPGEQHQNGNAPRVCLSIELPELRQPLGRARQFRIKTPIVWSLRSHTVPWWIADDRQRPRGVPGPLTVWRWAIGAPSPQEPRPGITAAEFFGDPHYEETESGSGPTDRIADRGAGQSGAAQVRLDEHPAGV
jgi:hypothetical protein